MLELKMVKESLFPNVLEAMLDLVDSANVDFSSTGLTLKAKDTEHITIITLHIPAKEFKHYHCDEGLSVGLPIDDMVNAIRCADKDDTITIEFTKENFESITLSYESPENSMPYNFLTYDLRLVDNDSQRFLAPEWDVLCKNYQAFVPMPSAEFMRICKYLSNIGDDVYISVTEKGLKFFASGESGHLTIEYMQSEKEKDATVATTQAPVSFAFELKYLCSIAKVSTLFSEVKICLSTMCPMAIEYKTEMGYIRYFLASNVKTEIEQEEIKKGKRKREEIKEGKSKRDDKDKGAEEKAQEEIKKKERGTTNTKGAQRKRCRN